MKATKLLLLPLLLVILLSACSNKPKDVSQEFWDEAIQITLYIDKRTDENATIRTNLVNGLKVVQDELSKGESEINRDLFNLADASDSYYLARPLGAEKGEVGKYEEEYKQNYDEAYSKLEVLFGSSTLEDAELVESEVEDIIAKYKEVAVADKNAKTEVDKAIREQKREELERIKNSNPTLGMTKEEVQMSLWGKPQKVNRTVNKYGVSEQWVYPNYKYLYFDDGILTSFQD